MSEKWEAYEYRDNLWAVRDEGSKLVGMGLFTKQQAQTIATEHNAHAHLLEVLVAAEEADKNYWVPTKELDMPDVMLLIDRQYVDELRQAIERARSQVGGTNG